MRTTNLKTLFIAGIACACMLAPVAANAQRHGDPNNRYRSDRTFRDLVDRTERESNSFRSDYEHQYRGASRGRNWRKDQYGFWGRNLTQDIQRMDESFERLRRDVDRRDWRGRDSLKEMDAIVRYSGGIDRDFRAGFGNYRGSERNLDREWRDLRADIDRLNREFSGPRR